MKVRIQRTDDAITYEEEWPDMVKSERVIKDLAEVNGDFFDLAYSFFECFPKFREIVFNTECTDNEQRDNQKRDN
jgi:hypothetical protein